MIITDAPENQLFSGFEIKPINYNATLLLTVYVGQKPAKIITIGSESRNRWRSPQPPSGDTQLEERNTWRVFAEGGLCTAAQSLSSVVRDDKKKRVENFQSSLYNNHAGEDASVINKSDGFKKKAEMILRFYFFRKFAISRIRPHASRV